MPLTVINAPPVGAGNVLRDGDRTPASRQQYRVTVLKRRYIARVTVIMRQCVPSYTARATRNKTKVTLIPRRVIRSLKNRRISAKATNQLGYCD